MSEKEGTMVAEVYDEARPLWPQGCAFTPHDVEEIAGVPVCFWLRASRELSNYVRNGDAEGIALYISDAIHDWFTVERIAPHANGDRREQLYHAIVAVAVQYLRELYGRNPHRGAVFEDVSDPCDERMEEYWL